MRLLIWIFLPALLVERFCLGDQSPDMLGLKWQRESAAKATGKEETKEETLFCQSVLQTLAGCIPPWSGWITSQGPPCLVRIHECHDGIHQDISTQNRKASSTDLGMAGMAMRAMRAISS